MDNIVEDGDPTDEELRGGGHGTHVAGTAGAKGNNSIGVTGVNQNAKIMPLRVCSYSVANAEIRCPFSAQVKAINYAGSKGAKVANMSLGGAGISTTIRTAMAANPNVLFVVSAGNGGADSVGDNNDSTPQSPCNLNPIDSGSSVDNVLCVAASNQSDAKAGFSNYGKTSVDVAAPGTEIYSSYFTKNYIKEDFQGTGFDNFNNNGFILSTDSPLITRGITNDTANQLENSTRTTETETINIQGPAACRIDYWRKITEADSDAFSYQFIVNGSVFETFNPSSQNAGFYTATSSTLPAGNITFAVRFNYSRGSGNPTTNGVWLDDIKLDCSFSPGLEDDTFYAYLQGTSMAAPQVTGIASLLWSLEPQANVNQVKAALMDTVEPIAIFHPDTGSFPIKSGGRVNAFNALNEIDENIAPDTTILSSPNNSTNNSATFTFTKAQTNSPDVTYECSLNNEAFSNCVSGISYNNLSVGNHDFKVRAKDRYNNVDATPANVIWTVDASNNTIPNNTPNNPSNNPIAPKIEPVKITKSKIVEKTVKKKTTYTLNFKSDKATKAKVEIFKITKGRKVDNKCVKTTKKNKKKSSCNLENSVNKFDLEIKAGDNNKKIKKKLSKGKYKLVISTDNGAKKDYSLKFDIE